MKLLIALILASVLVLKTAEGAAGDLDAECKPDNKCTDANAECTGTPKKCVCTANYEKSGNTCKLKNGQTCSANSECAKGTCPTDIKKCGKAKDAACDKNEECASGNCKTDGDSKKKCADGASAIVASVLLMVSALLTSRFL